MLLIQLAKLSLLLESGGGGLAYKLTRILKPQKLLYLKNYPTKNYIYPSLYLLTSKILSKLPFCSKLARLVKTHKDDLDTALEQDMRRDKIISICEHENIDVLIDSYWESLLKKTQKKLFTIKCIHGHFELLYHSNMKNYDTLVLLTYHEYEQWNKHLKYIKVIPNFAKDPKTISTYESKNLIFVGRLTQQKGILRLLEAFSKTKQGFHLTLVGDGEQKEELQNFITQNSLNASITGYTQNTGYYYKNSSIFVMTSFFEGLPMVLLEALSYGLPIIAYDVPTGPRDCIEDSKNGFLIKNGDEASLIKAIDKLSSYIALRRAFGARSKEIFLERFEESKILKLWLELLGA
ncbi:hypothetical protein BKH43_01175 [Helicobacter sp. 13S00401-1]|uniref:glycosyltransferase n=1 Tax=Helicobacter sp. 13S00401-1 TaxID=1905758 RepID=UPI000BA58D77|nr:glycosyltransferase [Helicobacter sp. 13S00401-1]PAF51874.1 hypothetical protein BKH43_01175 [Helicobacter sp. 13S00401-1]